MVRGLFSECSYPWAVKPAGLNGSIRHRLSGEGSGGELELCLRWGLKLERSAAAPPEDRRLSGSAYRDLIGERGELLNQFQGEAADAWYHPITVS